VAGARSAGLQCSREDVKAAMGSVSTIGQRFKKRAAVRTGRPPRELAGEVESRILDAARRVFLERGLAGASIDEIAELACAGKPTIYARFPGKEALFSAVVMRKVAANVARFANFVPAGATIEERLASVGATVLRQLLAGDTVGLLRLSIAEARRFPDLASSVHRMARERGLQAVARLLAEVAQSDELGHLPAFAPQCLAKTADIFLDLVVLPLLHRALHGEKPKVLCAEVEPHVTSSVAFFIAACRHGGVT
jgi:AcrR family transcriptional regulator